MSSPIIFIRVLPFDSNTVVWHTKSTVNKHTFFCENEDCGNETHCDTLCDSCRASLIALFVGGAENEHKCSPIRVDNGHVEYYDCDDADSPSCPQNRKPTKCCADCGCAPDDGYFSFYRGNEPLCPDCEKAAYGPPSPDDLRARSGACNKCGYHYMLICSSDRRDLCYSCEKRQRELKRCPDCHTTIHKEEELHENGVTYHGSCWFDRQR